MTAVQSYFHHFHPFHPFHPFHRVCQTSQWSLVKIIITIIIIIIILCAAHIFLLAATWAGLLWHDMRLIRQEDKTCFYHICHISSFKILHHLFPPSVLLPFPLTHRFLSLHTSLPSPAVSLNFSSHSRLTPHQNSARRLKMYPSRIHRIRLSKTPPGAWDLRLSLCNRKDWCPNPPPSLYPAAANSLRDMSNDAVSSDLIALRSLCTKEAG